MEYNNVTYVDSYWKVRDLCHAVKNNDSDAIAKAGILISKLIPSNSILVPIPSHNGNATYTKEISNIIASNKNCEVLDVLSREPSIPLYNQKLKLTSVENIDLKIHSIIKDINLSNKPVYLIDNVIETGKTYKTCVNAFKEVFGIEPKIAVIGIVDNESVNKLRYKNNYKRMFVEDKLRNMVRESIIDVLKCIY